MTTSAIPAVANQMDTLPKHTYCQLPRPPGSKEDDPPMSPRLKSSKLRIEHKHLSRSSDPKPRLQQTQSQYNTRQGLFPPAQEINLVRIIGVNGGADHGRKSRFDGKCPGTDGQYSGLPIIFYTPTYTPLSCQFHRRKKSAKLWEKHNGVGKRTDQIHTVVTAILDMNKLVANNAATMIRVSNKSRGKVLK